MGRKRVKKTEKKGLIQPSPQTIDIFPQRKMEKWEERLARILDGNSLSPREEFLRRYGLMVCQFRIARENEQSTDAIYREIRQLEDEGHNFGFKQEDLVALNRIFRDKTKTELGEFLEKLKGKAVSN